MLDVLPPTFIPQHDAPPKAEPKKVSIVAPSTPSPSLQDGLVEVSLAPSSEEKRDKEEKEEGEKAEGEHRGEVEEAKKEEEEEEGQVVPSEKEEEGGDQEGPKGGEDAFQSILVEDPSYSSMSIKELRELCSKRSLPSQGKKSVLIDRLLGRVEEEVP